jgi:biotin synthase
MIDAKVTVLVDDAVAGHTIDHEEALFLLGIKTHTPEAAYVNWGAHEISAKANGGVGQIFTQIGIDSTPCHENCIYCAYAACNQSAIAPSELSVDEVVGYAKLYDKLGIHLITIMATSSYDIDKYCNVIAAVREAVSDDMPIMANLGDIDEDTTQRLANLGVQAAYHVVRLREGKITRITPERRMKTIAAWKSAGVHLTSCIEPVFMELDPEEIVNAMEQIIATEPLESRVMSLSPVAGTPMETMHGVSLKRRSLINDVYRLMIGTRIPFGGSESTVWVNAGINPKGRLFSEQEEALAEEFKLQKKLMQGAEWIVPDRPLPIWFEH